MPDLPYSGFHFTELDSMAEQFDLIVKPSQINERFIRSGPTHGISRRIVDAVLAGNMDKQLSCLCFILPVTETYLRTGDEQLTVTAVRTRHRRSRSGTLSSPPSAAFDLLGTFG
jgi:hypothetical protein